MSYIFFIDKEHFYSAMVDKYERLCAQADNAACLAFRSEELVRYRALNEAEARR